MLSFDMSGIYASEHLDLLSETLLLGPYPIEKIKKKKSGKENLIRNCIVILRN